MEQKTLEATFDGAVFRPDTPPGIPPDTRCRISVEEIPSEEPRGNVWDVLERLAGTIDAPEDWAEEHDHYIHGTPKRRQSTAPGQ